MEFIGNYAHIIKQEWIDFVMANTGQLFPDQRVECMRPEFDEQNRLLYEIWRPENLPRWYQFEKQDLPFMPEWPVKLSTNIDWWIIKMLPGQRIPMHCDPCIPEKTSRYMMALQDWEPGHILMWGDQLFRDYKKGDMIKFKDPMTVHGSCNICNNVRLLAYLSVFDYED